MPAGLPCARVDFELTTKCGDAFWYFPYLMAIPKRWPRNSRRKSNLDYDRQSLGECRACRQRCCCGGSKSAPWMKRRRSIVMSWESPNFDGPRKVNAADDRLIADSCQRCDLNLVVSCNPVAFAPKCKAAGLE